MIHRGIASLVAFGLLVGLAACGSVASPAPINAPAVTSDPVAAQPAAAPPPVLPATFNGDNALRYAAEQMQWVPRDTGTSGWQAIGDWIIETLVQAGWDVEEQYFAVPENKQGRNIIARRGSGPLVILGAHYDSRRYADNDPSSAKRSEPVPAANDGASGVAVLLELARVLKPERLNEEVWLVFFDAEDNGAIGAWDWTLGSQDLAQKLPRAPTAVVVVDMIGDADQQIYLEETSTSTLRNEIWQVAADLGYSTFIAQTKYSMLDDHTAFLQKGYNAVDIIDFDYPPWHTTADTIDKLSAQALETVGRTLEVWLTQQ